MDPLLFLWLFFILSALQPAVQRRYLAGLRRRKLATLAEERNATVITLIHRQETLSFLGIPLLRHIDIDDSQTVLRAIQSAPKGGTIEIVLHTPGGLVLAASQIARALRDYEGRVVAVVPHYAMSGGTLIALAADEIVLDRHVALGPVDPQLGQYPAASLVEVAARARGTTRPDTTLRSPTWIRNAEPPCCATTRGVTRPRPHRPGRQPAAEAPPRLSSPGGSSSSTE